MSVNTTTAFLANIWAWDYAESESCPIAISVPRTRRRHYAMAKPLNAIPKEEKRASPQALGVERPRDVLSLRPQDLLPHSAS